MLVGEICTRAVVTCRRGTPVTELAWVMRDEGVEAIVVVELQADQHPRPVGIVTDCDLAVHVVANGADAQTLTAADLIVGELIRSNERESVCEALLHMRRKRVRRVPAVDDLDGLVGLLATEDLIRVLADNVASLASDASWHRAAERPIRRGRRSTAALTDVNSMSPALPRLD